MTENIKTVYANILFVRARAMLVRHLVQTNVLRQDYHSDIQSLISELEDENANLEKLVVHDKESI